MSKVLGFVVVCVALVALIFTIVGVAVRPLGSSLIRRVFLVLLRCSRERPAHMRRLTCRGCITFPFAPFLIAWRFDRSIEYSPCAAHTALTRLPPTEHHEGLVQHVLEHTRGQILHQLGHDGRVRIVPGPELLLGLQVDRVTPERRRRRRV